MSDTVFKAFERWVCSIFGGQRENDPGKAEECRNTGMWAPEAKYRRRVPAWLELMVVQAERQARDDQFPLVVLGEKGRDRLQSLVICRMDTLYDFFIGGHQEFPEEDNGPQADIESIDPT